MTRILLLAVGAVLLLDTLGSLASRAVPFEYSWLMFGSVVIYTVTGMAVARAAETDKVRQAWRAGMILGFVDATLGWAISWVIGPGRVDPAELGGAPGMAFTVFFAAMFASLFALAGGWFESRHQHA